MWPLKKEKHAPGVLFDDSTRPRRAHPVSEVLDFLRTLRSKTNSAKKKKTSVILPLCVAALEVVCMAVRELSSASLRDIRNHSRQDRDAQWPPLAPGSNLRELQCSVHHHPFLRPPVAQVIMPQTASL